MDYTRIARIHRKVFSMLQNSPEREKAISALSESDRHALYDYDMGVRSGRIQEIKIDSWEESEMTYEQYKRKMNSDYKGKLRDISKFAQENTELYQQYNERYHRERDEEIRLHNRRLS